MLGEGLLVSGGAMQHSQNTISLPDIRSPGSHMNSQPNGNSGYMLDRSSNNSSANTSRSSVPESKQRKPVSMQRAKVWTLEVENAFRFQLAGYRDSDDYLSHYADPEYWPEEGLVRCLRAKKTGFFMYFRKTRECEDKHLNRIILYQY